MKRCRELAGILFKHECRAPATLQCVRCHKPVCNQHARGQGYGFTCVTCLREAMQNPAQRSNLAHLRDDPYFFWYFQGANWYADPYGADDYALFDTSASEFGHGTESEWHGS